MSDLGPSTEARFAAAFATRAIIGPSAAADLIGLDVKTLEALSEAQIIRTVPKGLKHRGFTERDLRAYLIESPDVPCAPTTPKPRPRSVAPLKVVNFSERRQARRG